MLKSFLKQLFSSKATDPLVEGAYADEYNQTIQNQIQQKYLQRWQLQDTPNTPDSHPWLFDPCAPPKDWRYDPYYEIWINFKN